MFNNIGATMAAVLRSSSCPWQEVALIDRVTQLDPAQDIICVNVTVVSRRHDEPFATSIYIGSGIPADGGWYENNIRRDLTVSHTQIILPPAYGLHTDGYSMALTVKEALRIFAGDFSAVSRTDDKRIDWA